MSWEKSGNCTLQKVSIHFLAGCRDSKPCLLHLAALSANYILSYTALLTSRPRNFLLSQWVIFETRHFRGNKRTLLLQFLHVAVQEPDLGTGAGITHGLMRKKSYTHSAVRHGQSNENLVLQFFSSFAPTRTTDHRVTIIAILLRFHWFFLFTFEKTDSPARGNRPRRDLVKLTKKEKNFTTWLVAKVGWLTLRSKI